MQYQQTKSYWNKVFENENITKTNDITTHNHDLDLALDWLTANISSIIDFGCGNGSLLIKCMMRGTSFHYGIDLSEKAIDQAKRRIPDEKINQFCFEVGGVESLKNIKSKSFDGAILSNIVDNVIIEDALTILNEINRIVKEEGKIFFKINSYLTKELIKEWNIKELESGLLLEDTGLYLYNLTTESWIDILKQTFNFHLIKDLYYKQFQMYNRLFLLINK